MHVAEEAFSIPAERSENICEADAVLEQQETEEESDDDTGMGFFGEFVVLPVSS